MKHLFVPYEIALKLKEKGFNEPCFMSYEEDQELCERGVKSYNYYYTEDEDKFHCSAPLHQQVIDWFREKHKLLIVVTNVNYPSTEMYGYDINKLPSGVKVMWEESQSVHTYYEALNNGIEEALKLI